MSDASADSKVLPVPDGYPVEGKFSGTPAKPILTSKLARLYRTMIRRGAAQGPNFAGHYTIVSWGCGLGSYMLVVVDARDGRVIEPPFGCITLTEYGIPGASGDDSENPAFRLNSRLLVTIGVEDTPTASPGDRAAKFYDFANEKFKLIYTLRIDEDGNASSD